MSGAIETRHLLKKLVVPKNKLQELTKNGIDGIINAGRISRIWVNDSEYGYPFLSSTAILQADLSFTSLIAKSVAQQNRLLFIEKNWTLITRSGSIGRMVYARTDMDGMACTEDVLRVIPDDDKVLSGYIYAFLSSKFGVPIVISGTYGAVIQHIEPQHIADLPVPRLGEVEKHVHKLIQQSADELSEHSRLMNEATVLLLEKAGLKESENYQYLADSRRLGWPESNFNSFSLRALNYDLRSRQLWDAVADIRHDHLGDLVEMENFEGHIVFKRIDCEPDYGVMLVGQRDAFQLHPEGRWISKKSIEGLGLLVPPGTTVIPCHGTLGEGELYCRAALVTKRSSKYAFSGDFYRCIPKEDAIASGYLYAFLRSRYAFRMFRSMSTGSKQQYQHPKLMEKMPIPRLDSKIEKEIAEMVDRASHLRDHALDLEDEARALVEKAIEEAAQ